MKQKMILRPHQSECIDTLNAYPEKYAVAEVSVAGGKSLILGCLAGYNTGRTLILAHNKELVIQNADACRQVGITPGICSASIAKNVYRKVTVGTVQTVVRRTKHFQDVTLILVDEVHRTPVNKTSSYRQVFEAIPNAKVRGLTGIWRFKPMGPKSRKDLRSHHFQLLFSGRASGRLCQAADPGLFRRRS